MREYVNRSYETLQIDVRRCGKGYMDKESLIQGRASMDKMMVYIVESKEWRDSCTEYQTLEEEYYGWIKVCKRRELQSEFARLTMLSEIEALLMYVLVWHHHRQYQRECGGPVGFGWWAALGREGEWRLLSEKTDWE